MLQPCCSGAAKHQPVRGGGSACTPPLALAFPHCRGFPTCRCLYPNPKNNSSVDARTHIQKTKKHDPFFRLPEIEFNPHRHTDNNTKSATIFSQHIFPHSHSIISIHSHSKHTESFGLFHHFFFINMHVQTVQPSHVGTTFNQTNRKKSNHLLLCSNTTCNDISEISKHARPHTK